MNRLRLVAHRRGIAGTLVRVEIEVERGYLVRTDATGRPTAITCLVCGFTSANESDIAERFCGRCREFHERS